jgi:eukaryotic-like serine/threonine-protein kinase
VPLAVVGGEYRLVELVAADALGSVYHAHHLFSGRVVAVRLLRPVGKDPAAMAAFQAELPVIAGLRHPNVLAVERWGDLDGVPFVVTPLPDAEPLAEHLERGWRPDPATALRLLRGIADGVDSAHELGVVHGDLEPANLLVVADGTALVGHFGLARLAGATPHAEGMAPERVRGEAAGPAADVYSFSVIARRLLIGTAPLDGDSSSHPTAADGVIRRGLDGDPAARWATCGQLVDALEAVLALRTQPAPPARTPAPVTPNQPATPSSPPARSRWPRVVVRGRTALAAAGGVVLLAGIAAVVLAFGRFGPPLPADVGGQALLESPRGSSPVSQGAGAGSPGSTSPGASPRPSQSRGRPSPSPSRSPGASPDPSASQPTSSLPAAPPGSPQPTPTVAATPTPTVAPTPTPTAAPAGVALAVAGPPPRAGDYVQVSGSGFDPRQQYVIDLRQNGRTWSVWGTSSPRADGSFAVPVRIPAGAQTGTGTLVACVYLVNQGPTTRCAQAPVTVRP